MSTYKINYGFSENEIKEFIKLFNSFNLEEINLEFKESSIQIKKQLPIELRLNEESSTFYQTKPLLQNEINPIKKSINENFIENKAQKKKYHKILSPIAGTFYRAPSPEANPFVNEGDKILSNKTLCIIEAMKCMNEIKAEISGKIVKILVKNENAVYKGQEIFLVDLDK